MKICWDNLEKITYNRKTEKWLGGLEYYESCEYCNEPFLGRKIL